MVGKCVGLYVSYEKRRSMLVLPTDESPRMTSLKMYSQRSVVLLIETGINHYTSILLT